MQAEAFLMRGMVVLAAAAARFGPVSDFASVHRVRWHTHIRRRGRSGGRARGGG